MWTFLIYLSLSWLSLFALLKYLETHHTTTLTTFMRRHNVTLTLGYIDFYTTRYNTHLQSFGRRNRRWLSLWFQLGVFFGFVGMVLSTVILSGNFLARIYWVPSEVRFFGDGDVGMVGGVERGVDGGMRGRFTRVDVGRGRGRGEGLGVSLVEMFKDRYRHESEGLGVGGGKGLFGDGDGDLWRRHRRERVEAKSGRVEGDGLKEVVDAQSEENVSEQDLYDGDDRKVNSQLNTLTIGKNSDGRRERNAQFYSKKNSVHFHTHDERRGFLAGGPYRSRTVYYSKFASGKDKQRRQLLEHILSESQVENKHDQQIQDGNRIIEKNNGRFSHMDQKSTLAAQDGHMVLPNVMSRFAIPDAHARERVVRYYSHRGSEAMDKAEHLWEDIEKDAEAVAKRYFPPSKHNNSIFLLPGINMPLTDLLYVVIGFLVSVVFHELGHALAAGAEDSRIIGVGGFFALVFPGAYVTLDDIPKLSTKRQLRVYCAGAWHNVFLAIVCLAAATWLPLLVSPLYAHDQGALVVAVPQNSPLTGHLSPGDTILSIGPFRVSDGGPSFRKAISKLEVLNNSVGFCISDAMHKAASLPSANCCPLVDNGTEHPTLQCFGVLGTDRRTCIPPTLVSGFNTCRSPSDCYKREIRKQVSDDSLSTSGRVVSEEGVRYGGRGSPMRCYSPILPNKQQLVDIQVRSARHGATRHYFYQGYAEILGKSVTVSSFIVRGQNVLPESAMRLLARIDVPNKVEKMFNFIAGVSLSMGIFNMAPVFHLDGATTIMLFVKAVAPNMSEYHQKKWRKVILVYGTLLLFANILISLL